MPPDCPALCPVPQSSLPCEPLPVVPAGELARLHVVGRIEHRDRRHKPGILHHVQMLNENALEPAGRYNVPHGLRVGWINLEVDGMCRTSPELPPPPSMPRIHMPINPTPHTHVG